MHGTPAKNKRGDLPTILITPEENGFDPQVRVRVRARARVKVWVSYS